MKKPLMVAVRALHIARVVAYHAAVHALCSLPARWIFLRRFQWIERAEARALSGPERLRAAFEDVGGTAIKFGQMLALQPDIIPLRYCNALFNLLDRVAPYPYSVVEQTFIQELGKRPEEIFDSIDTAPVATASVGQVHIAWLNGRKLAVKVQRPAVQDHFAGDMRLMSAAVVGIRKLRLKPLYWMIEPMQEFLAWTHEELDYRHEARYMHRLRLNADKNAFERVPEVIWELTTTRTLVAEFLEGVTLMSYIRAVAAQDRKVLGKLEAGGFEPSRVAANIIDNFLGDVFRHGMFHADLHPANLMILPGNVVGYIDFGITGTISQHSRMNLIALTLAYTRGDLDALTASFVSVCATSPASDVAGFRAGLAAFSSGWYREEAGGRRLKKNFTLVMLDMLTLSRVTSIWPARDVIKYIRSAIAIDGLLTRFAPGFDLGRYLESVCSRYLRWQERASAFTFQSLLDSIRSSAALLWDGPARINSALGRWSAGPAPPLICRGKSRTAVERDALVLALTVFSTALLLGTEAGPAAPGWNASTSGIVVIVSAGILLTTKLRKLKEVAYGA